MVTKPYLKQYRNIIAVVSYKNKLAIIIAKMACQFERDYNLDFHKYIQRLFSYTPTEMCNFQFFLYKTSTNITTLFLNPLIYELLFI